MKSARFFVSFDENDQDMHDFWFYWNSKIHFISVRDKFKISNVLKLVMFYWIVKQVTQMQTCCQSGQTVERQSQQKLGGGNKNE